MASVPRSDDPPPSLAGTRDGTDQGSTDEDPVRRPRPPSSGRGELRPTREVPSLCRPRRRSVRGRRQRRRDFGDREAARPPRANMTFGRFAIDAFLERKARAKTAAVSRSPRSNSRRIAFPVDILSLQLSAVHHEKAPQEYHPRFSFSPWARRPRTWTKLFMRSPSYRAAHGMHAWNPRPTIGLPLTMAPVLSP